MICVRDHNQVPEQGHITTIGPAFREERDVRLRAIGCWDWGEGGLGVRLLRGDCPRVLSASKSRCCMIRPIGGWRYA